MTLEELRQLAAERLDPLDAWDPATEHLRSDFDLNPEWRPTTSGPLRDAAVLIPVVERASGLSVILTRRSDTLTSHRGQVAFPGGRLEPGEGPVEAAVREAYEEVGLDPALVEPLGLCSRYETVTSFVVTPVLALVGPGATLTPSPDEVAEVFEAPLDFLMNEANHERRFHEDPDGRKRWFYAMPYQGQFIWGATAGMLRDLAHRLYGSSVEPARNAS